MTPEKLMWIVFKSFSYHGAVEIVWLCDILEKIKLKNVLEIGVAYGVSLMVWEYLMEPGGLLVGVDNDSQSKAYEMLTHFIESRKKNIKLILGNSEDPETIKKVKEYFPSRTIDFLFIDGNHEYKYAKQDYLNYGPLVRPGGIIAFHDINHIEIGMNLLWQELKSKKNLQIEEYKIHNGVGVIHVKE